MGGNTQTSSEVGKKLLHLRRTTLAVCSGVVHFNQGRTEVKDNP